MALSQTPSARAQRRWRERRNARIAHASQQPEVVPTATEERWRAFRDSLNIAIPQCETLWQRKQWDEAERLAEKAFK